SHGGPARRRRAQGARGRAPRRALSPRGAARHRRRAADAGLSLELRAALPAVREERRGERSRRSLHPVPQDLAGPQMKVGRFGFSSLQATFLWATVLVLFLLMSAVIVVVDHRQRVAIIDE